DDINQKKELLKDLKQKKTSVNYQPAPSKLNSSDHPVKKRGRPRKVPIINTQPKCKTTMMTDTDTEDENEDEDADEDQITNKIASNAGGKGLDKSLGNTVAGSRISSSLPSENQESGPRRSGRPPKLNERLLNYLHLDEGLLGESGHLSKKRKENSNLLSPKKIKKHEFYEESKIGKDNEVIVSKIRTRPVNNEPGPAVRTVRNTSIGERKAIGRLKSISPEKPVSKNKESITDIKKTMISRLLSMGDDISKKMLKDDTETLLELATNSSDNLDNPLADLNLENPIEDLDDETTEKILKWLDEEERDRQCYRRKLLESMKKSHEKTMEMYNQMLKALEAV
ncbi:unnamed protein product, partial [Meganyctiphanes norvegica]